MNGPSASEIAENWTGPDYEDEDLAYCDRCSQECVREEMHQHSDGNLYCDNCDYETEEDRMWAEADRLSAEEQGR